MRPLSSRPRSHQTGTAVAKFYGERDNLRGWRGVVMTPKTVAEIERLRRQPAAEPTDREEVVAA
jgi:hypothetical protein